MPRRVPRAISGNHRRAAGNLRRAWLSEDTAPDFDRGHYLDESNC
jgi:hypothetical protein